jgi:nitrite reductase/ring-hydroxylating ferredoxin subunit
MSTPSQDHANTNIDDSSRAVDSGLTQMPRRTVLAAAGAVGVAGVLAACGSTDSDSAGETEPDTTTDVPDDSAAIASTSDVPVAGATLVESRAIVVTQPTEGEFKAFEARCPHQGCLASETEDSNILCPCHASLFSAETGEVLRGPATSGLPEVPIKISGTDIVTA